MHLKSKNKVGFSAEEIDHIESIYGNENIMKTYCYEVVEDGKVTRVYSLDINNNNINVLEIMEGRLPENEFEILIERQTKLYKGAHVGDTIEINGVSYTVSGIANNPLLMHRVQEPSYTKSGTYVTQVAYVHTASLTTVNDIYITLENREQFDFFNEENHFCIAQIKSIKKRNK